MTADLGVCLWQIANKKVCGETATAKITLRDRITKARMPVCQKHKAEHDHKASRLRNKS